MSLNVLSKVLPYALMAFIGIAGWSMNSVPLLAIVVLGTVGVAIGTSMATKPDTEPEGSLDLNITDNEIHHEVHPEH